MFLFTWTWPDLMRLGLPPPQARVTNMNPPQYPSAPRFQSSPCSRVTKRSNPRRSPPCCWFPRQDWAWRWPVEGGWGKRAWRCHRPHPPCWRRRPQPPPGAPGRCGPASPPAAAVSGCGCCGCLCRSVPVCVDYILIVDVWNHITTIYVIIILLWVLSKVQKQIW